MADLWAVPVRHVRPHRLPLLPGGAVPVLVARPTDRAFAVRPVADRDSRERAAHACDRCAGQTPPPGDLHDLCWIRWHGWGIDRPDDAVRRSRLPQPRPLL